MAKRTQADIQRETAIIAAVITNYFFEELYEVANNEKEIGGYHFCLDTVSSIAVKLEKQTRKLNQQEDEDAGAWEEELERTGDISWEDYIARLAEDELRQSDLLKPKYYSVWAENEYLNSGFNSTNKKDLKDAILSLIESETDKKDFNAFKKMEIEQICAIKGWSVDVNPQPIPEGEEI